MSGWSNHSGIAVSLAVDNIDTDQLIPARFMSQPRSDGYADFLLHDVRRDSSGELDPTFVLQKHPSATVLIAGRNFGIGSSREAAAYALLDAGICAVIASGFGDIFAANAVNNGLLPAHVENQSLDELQQIIGLEAVGCNINLLDSTLTVSGTTIVFALDESWRKKLISGWDEFDLTLAESERIENFRTHYFQGAPWTLPNGKKAST
ncbi:3-isopropylmalate dehydratase small subunit [Granulosicoccus sp.]|nr:3-isopropylmalate dehydratase small subunit [Granulosicoccus sp.]MDB4224265.1 3-isopropylmalate dehydratase small subunit [Granulosicoccus sp.]